MLTAGCQALEELALFQNILITCKLRDSPASFMKFEYWNLNFWSTLYWYLWRLWPQSMFG